MKSPSLVRSKGEKEKTKEARLVLVVDLENLIFNSCLPPLESFSRSAGFERLIKKLEEIGEIVAVFVFAPRHLIPNYEELFHKMGFFTISCPKIKEDGVLKDTVDQKLIDLGRIMLEYPGLTHFCLGSGDEDFLPLLGEASEKGLKIIIAAGDHASLSKTLSDMAIDKGSRRKNIIIFSQRKTESQV